MPRPIHNGTLLSCTHGTVPMPMIVPEWRERGDAPQAATIMEFVPKVNIPPFGLCTSTFNPAVVAATAAAHGVLTPMPCIPVTMSPWQPGNPNVLVGGMPALCIGSICLCQWLGEISIDELE